MTGIYIHIPFCVRKCNYCAFLSFPADADTRALYVQQLIKEAGRFPRRKVDTVYFGGGTPSVLEADQIAGILDEVRRCYDITDDAEITLEANPGTLGESDADIRNRLEAYRSMGINRLSIGVQAMNDDRLKFLGRIHTVEDVRRDYSIARELGYDNINLDLIMSVPTPGNSIDEALYDAKEIVKLKPEHISCYSLQLEEDTPFFAMYERGELQEIPDDIDRDTYHKVCDFLKEAGYEHYEISNFCKPGRMSRHNSKYWNMSDYIGLGLGASGFVDGVRYRNTENLGDYLNGKCSDEEHINTEHDNISEAVFTGLRRNEGIRYSDVFPGSGDARDEFWQYYKDARDEAEGFVRTGHLIIDDEGLRLTESGIDISNRIMALFV